MKTKTNEQNKNKHAEADNRWVATRGEKKRERKMGKGAQSWGDRNQTFGGEHDVSTTDANWECCTPGTYAMLQTNVTLTVNI